MSGVWVAGEALIDLVPDGSTRRAIVGGGAANTAKALANLGIKAFFIGGISEDDFGSAITNELSGVDLSLAVRSSLPTALAIVTLDGSGSASYEFKLDETATFDFRELWLPKGSPEVLHIGTLATVVEPGSNSLFEWASSLNAPIIYDPNIRPSVLGDQEKYREVVKKWASISKIVKLSTQDLDWLGHSDVTFLLDLGVELVVLTKGELGLSGFTRSSVVSVPSVQVNVVDTVGAGDTVGAVLLEGVLKFGLAKLIDERLESVLHRAAKAASITCTRAGAKPPRLEELD